MANPNLLNLTSTLCFSDSGKVMMSDPYVTIIANPEGSGAVYRVCALYVTHASDVDTDATTCFTVRLCKGNNQYNIVTERILPFYEGQVKVISGDAPIFLLEGDCIDLDSRLIIHSSDTEWTASWEVLS